MMKSVVRIASGRRRGWSSRMTRDEMMMRIISRGSAFVVFSCNGGEVERFRTDRLSFSVS